MINRSFSGSNVRSIGEGMDYSLFDGLCELNELAKILRKLGVVDIYKDMTGFENIEYLRRIGFGEIRLRERKS